MSGLLDLIFEAVGSVLAHPAIGLAVRLGLLYLGIVWLAAAWWAYRDAQKRTRSPLVPYAAAASVILLTPFLFPLAVVVWRVMRPGLTIAEERAGWLQRELLEDDATREGCPGCGLAVDAGWVRCPACRTELATPCHACGRNVAWDWTICAWCAKDLATAAGAGDRQVDAGVGPAPRLGDPGGIVTRPGNIRPSTASAPGRRTGVDARPSLARD